jgi:hypothetical protein
MKKSYFLFLISIFAILNHDGYSQETFGSFKKLKSIPANVPADTLTKYSSVRGFCYNIGYLWVASWQGYVYQIDTTGSLRNIIDLGLNGLEGAIDVEQDTIWVANGYSIYAFDTSGNSLMDPIDFGQLGEPFASSYINGLVKDGNTFWLSQCIMPVIFQIDRNGNLLKQYPNSWYDYWSNTITMVGDKIIKKTESGSFMSNNINYDAVISIDKNSGLIDNMWDYPTVFQGVDMPVGLSAGENCFWVITTGWETIEILKLSIPEPSPIPDISNNRWGDFTIADWGYSPIRPSNIEGLNGFEYDKQKKQFWIGEYGQKLARFQNSDEKISPIDNFYNKYLFLIYDIAINNDTIWVADCWSGWWSPRVLQLILKNDSLDIVKEWNLGFDQVDGLATNGIYLWASGRTNTVTTGDYSNEIKKFDFSGNLIDHFYYPDSVSYHLNDLTWHKNSLWAITGPGPGLFSGNAIIYSIDANTGFIQNRYQTGWQHSTANASPTLASDGEYLYTLGTLPFTTFETYEQDHLRLLKLEVSLAPVAEFSSDYTEGIVPLAIQFTDNSTGDISNWLWNFGDGNTSNEQNPGHSYTTAGTYTVSLTVTGGGGTDTETKTAWIKAFSQTGIPDKKAESTFRIYPNPASSSCSVCISLEKSSHVDIRIYDSQSQLVSKPDNMFLSAGKHEFSLDISHLSAGIYYMTIGSDSWNMMQKLVIKE